MVDATRAEPGLRHGEAAALGAEQVLGRYPGVVEDDLGMATVRPVRVPEDLHAAAHLDARRAAGYQDHALPAVRFGIREGQNPRLVLGLTAAPPVALVVDAAHGRLRTVADLAGQRVALSAPGAAEHAWLTLLLARARLTPTQIHLTSVGNHGLERALMSGEVRAALVPEPMASRLLAERRTTLLADLRSPAATQQALGVPTVSAAVFVRAERRPGERELAAFTRAIQDFLSRA